MPETTPRDLLAALQKSIDAARADRKSEATKETPANLGRIRGDRRKENLAAPDWGTDWKARAEAAEATVVRLRALADAFADDGLTRHGGNIAWHIECAIANEKDDFPDAADRRIASQRARAEKAEAERDAAREALARVEALHRPDGGTVGPGAMCVTCTPGFGTPSEDPVPWPCPTTAALAQPATDEGAGA